MVRIKIQEKSMKKPKVETPIKLNISTDIKDPQKFPWNVKSESVSELACIGVFEFVPGPMRGKFMDEVFRVLIPDGKAFFKVPYWSSTSAYQDYMIAQPPLTEASFCYFNKIQRDAIGLKRDIVCNFDVGFGYDVPPDIASKSDETRSFNLKYYTNVIQALNITMTKKV